MTKQEAFDKVWKWFVVDGNGPSRNFGSCFYRSPKGCRCAVGVLIPDDLYEEGFECDALPLVLEKLFFKGFPLECDLTYCFLSRLQSVHDDATDCEDFAKEVKRNLECFANIYDLEVP